MAVEITCDYPGCTEVVEEPDQVHLCRVDFSYETVKVGPIALRGGGSLKAAWAGLCPAHRTAFRDALIQLGADYGFQIVVT